MTINIKNNILLAAEKRNDEWGKEVYGRISACNDLVAEEAVYHLTCLGKFNNKTGSDKDGRPVNEEKANFFEMLCEWLEKDGDCELYTLQELLTKMEELNSGNFTFFYRKNILVPKVYKNKSKHRNKTTQDTKHKIA